MVAAVARPQVPFRRLEQEQESLLIRLALQACERIAPVAEVRL